MNYNIEELKLKIMELKKERNAIILAHNYQNKEIQDIADYLGDSLELSKRACNVKEDVIVFCGVHFMAESAKILSKDKKVLLPVKDATCPMADMVTFEALKEEKEKYKDLKIVCYVNSSAKVKSISDISCTSSNAVDIVNSIESENILFVPDCNLGSYVKEKTNKNIILWEGFCPTHHRVCEDSIIKMKENHKNVKILTHPECKKEVLKHSDFVGSTSAIINYVKDSEDKEFIIGTEEGILHKLKKDNKDKNFYLLDENLVCKNMKKTKLIDVYNALLNMENEINLDDEVIIGAKSSLDAMLNLNKN
ncbi:quinolinate synthase NadA [Peptostreptococcaceae bacterium AGR-M142]